MPIQFSTDEERKKLFRTPINRLHLVIPGSPLEPHIQLLYEELRANEIAFRPSCYLSDEWGCPHGLPIIGIPFYLADETLKKLEGEMTNTPAETAEEIMMYLRHEAGHAINYAFKLFLQPEWKHTFGSFSRPYRERYQSIPRHKAYVAHLPDWYAQKHPDEDFAETFAVWLTPGSEWRRRYGDTPAILKLDYVDSLMREVRSATPLVKTGPPDLPVEEIDMTLSEWYDSQSETKDDKVK